MMNFQDLQYFMSVAKNKNFTKAAEECYITQPALTRKIKKLESELGCILFIRTTRSVEITSAGEACLKEAEKILLHQHKLKEIAYEHANDTISCIRIGYFSYSHLSFLHSRISTKLRTVEMDTIYTSLSDAIRGLQNEAYDAITLPQIVSKEYPEFDTFALATSRAYVLCHKSHPLASLQELSIADIQNEKYVAWDEKVFPGLNVAHRSLLARMGRPPEAVATGKNIGDVLNMIYRYSAIALIAQQVSITLPPEYCSIPVMDSEEDYGIVLAWLRSNENTCLQQFLNMLSE